MERDSNVEETVVSVKTHGEFLFVVYKDGTIEKVDPVTGDIHWKIKDGEYL